MIVKFIKKLMHKEYFTLYYFQCLAFIIHLLHRVLLQLLYCLLFFCVFNQSIHPLTSRLDPSIEVILVSKKLHIFKLHPYPVFVIEWLFLSVCKNIEETCTVLTFLFMRRCIFLEVQEIKENIIWRNNQAKKKKKIFLTCK